MMIGDLGAEDATELAALVARGEVSPTELLDAALSAVEERNPAINAVVLIQEGIARKSIADGLPPGPFRGVPFLIKDLGIEARDFPSHNGSRLLANTTYPGDSSIFARIKATGFPSSNTGATHWSIPTVASLSVPAMRLAASPRRRAGLEH